MTAILKLDHYRKENKTLKKTGITKKPGSNKLYVDIRPNGIRVQKSSGMDDTPENRKVLQEWVDRQLARIKAGSFEFSEAFPNAPEKEKATHAALEGRIYKHDSNKILFVDYCDVWMDKTWMLSHRAKKGIMRMPYTLGSNRFLPTRHLVKLPV